MRNEEPKREAETVSASGTPETNAASANEKPETNAASANEKPDAPPAQKGSMSVFLYILLLFSAALLLMCLSSLIHQRNNTEALGKLQSSVSVMQEVQNLQDKIIKLHDDLRDAEDELRNAEDELERTQAAQSEAEARADASQKRAEALERLYIMEAQYQEGRYRACQGSIEAFAASGLLEHLPTESPGGGVVSPLERYRQLQDATFARLHPPTVETPPETVN